jgi:hypothetical protein
MRFRLKVALVLSAAMLGSLFSAAVTIAPAEAASKPAWTKNCTQLNKKYPHGVGKKNAKDTTSSGKKTVTNFKKSDSLYKTAMSYNKGLDRDKDGIACEKA